MSTRIRSNVAAIAATLAVATGGLAAAPASAEGQHPPPDPLTRAAAIADAQAGEPAVAAKASSAGLTAHLAGGDVKVSTDPRNGTTIAGARRSAVRVGVPGRSVHDGATVGRNVVYRHAFKGAAVVARPTREGAQSLVIIDGPSAPITFAFPITVDGEPADLLLTDAGTVEIRASGSTRVVAIVQLPWAIDAHGDTVPTRFRIDGNHLIQIVDHEGAAYPVTADPTTCGWTTCTYYFGKRATKDIATSSAGVACSVALKYVPPAGIGCIAVYLALHTQASRAKNRGMCLKIKYVRFGPTVWWPDSYSGKYCR